MIEEQLELKFSMGYTFKPQIWMSKAEKLENLGFLSVLLPKMIPQLRISQVCSQIARTSPKRADALFCHCSRNGALECLSIPSELAKLFRFVPRVLGSSNSFAGLLVHSRTRKSAPRVERGF
jgi:hypothetical protein